jgi:hypothetical protein
MADDIDNGFVELARYIEEHPRESVTLPDIVSVSVSFGGGRRSFSEYTPDAPVQQSVGLVRQNLKAPTVASKSVSVRFCTVMPVTTGIEFMVVNIGHTSST